MKVLSRIIIFSLSLFATIGSMGQEAVKKKIQKFQDSGKTFERISPFRHATAKGIESLRSLGVKETALLEGTAFFLDENDGKSLKADLTDLLRIELPTAGEPLEVLLYEQTIFADDAKISTSDEPNVSLPLPEMRFYRGIVVGEEHSLVAMTFSDNEINGLVSYDSQTYVLGKIKDSETKTHIWYKDQDLLLDETFSCETMPSENHLSSPKEEAFGSPKTTNCVRLRVEIDSDIVADFGGSTEAIEYTTSLFNQVVILFANDDIDLVVSEIFAWVGSSPYTGGLSNRLDQMSNNSADADLTQLVTGASGGGIAYLSGLCSEVFGVSVAGIFGFFNDVPSYSWDVNVAAHEIGHNLSSDHTHACAWNGNNTAIDGCGPLAGYSEGCIASLPSNGGTIMSYCHLLSVGVNFNLGFGPQPSTRMTNYVNSRTCLGTSCVTEPEPGCTDESLSLTINLDQYPAETTWEIVSGSAVVASGGPYGNQFATVVEDICLPVDCYTLNFFDSYGDGICCGYGDGSYQLTEESGAVLVFGGKFLNSETSSFCLSEATECPFINFNEYSISSYIPFRDNGTWSVQEEGTAIILEDNSLKYIPINYDVTPETKISFEFKSTDQGSLHAIGLENNTSASLPLLFKVHGSINNQNIISDFDIYSGNNYQSFTIPVGSFYTGNDRDLVVLSLNVNGSPGNNSYFRNILIYEGDACEGTPIPQSLKSSSTSGDFVLFPNPTRELVKLSSASGLEIRTIQIFNITGTLIDQISINGPQATLEFTDKSPGIYLVKWTDEYGSSHQEKLVKTQ